MRGSLATGDDEAVVAADEVREAGREPAERHHPRLPGVRRHDLLLGHAGVLATSARSGPSYVTAISIASPASAAVMSSGSLRSTSERRADGSPRSSTVRAPSTASTSSCRAANHPAPRQASRSRSARRGHRTAAAPWMPHVRARVLEGDAHRSHDVEGAGAVAVDADRVDALVQQPHRLQCGVTAGRRAAPRVPSGGSACPRRCSRDRRTLRGSPAHRPHRPAGGCAARQADDGQTGIADGLDHAAACVSSPTIVLYSAPWGLTYVTSPSTDLASFARWAICPATSSRRASGAMSIGTRPKPSRSGYPTCAPMATSRSTQVLHVAVMSSSSPA